MAPLPSNVFKLEYSTQYFLDLNYIIKFFNKFHNLRPMYTENYFKIELVKDKTYIFFYTNKKIIVHTYNDNAISVFGEIDNWIMKMSLPLRYTIINKTMISCVSNYLNANSNVINSITISNPNKQTACFGKSLLPSSM
jgi:thiamine pyrophosphokinase